MRLSATITGLVFASTVAFANAAPVDLLPPGFGDPTPTPTPTPVPAPTPTAAQNAPPSSGSSEQGTDRSNAGDTTQSTPRANLPTLRELESLATDDLDELLGLRPRVDIPAAVARSTDVTGVIGPEEGGLDVAVLANQPASLVRAALEENSGRYVSRWGHILMRRALSSRLQSPDGFDPVAFATQRVALLNRMGEYGAARSVAQSVDTANYSPGLAQGAIEAYLATGDIVGACPAVRLSRTDRDDGEWQMLRAVCNAYAGETTRATSDLRRLQNSAEFPRIDVLLAQRYAGAAGNGRRAVTIEWEGVNTLSRWRFALANALGEPIPQELLTDGDPGLLELLATTAAVAPPERVGQASRAATRGVLSGQALIDLYSQIAAIEEFDGPGAETANTLRTAYTAGTGTARLDALEELWGDEELAGYILTAQAAAHIPADPRYRDDAADLLRAMLSGGFDRNAARWASVVEDGSIGWALLAVASPRGGSVSDGSLSRFVDDDDTDRAQRSRFLFAGLAGLGRLGQSELNEYSDRLDVDLTRANRWTRAIEGARRSENAGMAVLLAGLGMQGSDWSQMTPLYLYHIVRALTAAGLEAEARMIAAEAVASA